MTKTYIDINVIRATFLLENLTGCSSDEGSCAIDKGELNSQWELIQHSRQHRMTSPAKLLADVTEEFFTTELFKSPS